jgi:predicted nuclease of predicted toxin-antitoxin system
LNFLVDAQLPPAMARWISNRGHEASHVFDVGLQSARDNDVWERARTSNAVVVSKDEDFVDRWLVDESPVALMWIRKGNCSTRTLLTWFEPLWPDALHRLEHGERFVELRDAR